MMQDRNEAIEKHLDLIETLHLRGAYPQSYERARLVLDLCGKAVTAPQVRCRVFILSAKSAYYAGAFEESLSLLGAADSLRQQIGHDVRDRFAREVAVVRANVLRRQGHFAEALRVLEATAMDADSEPAILLERFLIEGACRFYLNDISRSEESLEAALGLSIHYKNTRMKSRVLAMLGLVAQIKGLLETAFEYFERAGDLCRANADYYGEAAAALNASIALYRRGRFGRAAESAERARAIFESIGWVVGVCRALLSLGNVAKYCGDERLAARRYREARRLANRHGFLRERALALEFAGELHAARGRHRFAERCYGEALRIAESIAPEGDVVVEIDRRIGELLLDRELVDAALPFLRRALRFSQRLGDRLEEGVVLRCLGVASFRLGTAERGANLFARAIETLSSAGCAFELARTHFVYAQLSLDRCEAEGIEGGNEGFGSTRLDEALRNAVEAAHLFGGMDIDHHKAAAENLVMRVTEARARARIHAPEILVSPRTVEIKPSPAVLLHEGFVAISAVMMEIWKQIRFAAAFDRPVLVTGETGIGKELVARLIHDLSCRRGRPFVPLNCAAVPDHLFESEFFGHRRGSFTGALVDRIGLFEAANGGTLFLDEVGELTPLQQVKLLRVLQEEKVRRLGENAERVVDVRIVSATNQDLEEKITNRSLRKDFFYRINAEHIHLPPLRERREDIVPLIAHFLSGNGDGGRPAMRMELAALRSLQRYAWPGNVRELIAVLERVRHMAGGGEITVDMLPDRIRTAAAATEAAGSRTAPKGDAVTRLRRALEACGGNKSAAARWLGISRGTLYKEMRKYGILYEAVSRHKGAVGISPEAAGPPGKTAA